MDFEEFWDLYDKKVGKLKTMNKYNRLTKKQVEKIAEHLPRYVEATPDKQFRKNPHSYLNQHAWEDEIIMMPKTGNKVNRRFPDFYDQRYIRENRLTGQELSDYYAHLRSLGFEYDRFRRVWKEVPQ